MTTPRIKPAPYLSTDILPESMSIPKIPRVGKVGENFSQGHYTHGDERVRLTGVIWEGTLTIPLDYLPQDVQQAGPYVQLAFLDQLHRHAFVQVFIHPGDQPVNEHLVDLLDKDLGPENPAGKIANELFRLSQAASDALRRAERRGIYDRASLHVSTDLTPYTQRTDHEEPHLELTARVTARLDPDRLTPRRRHVFTGDLEIFNERLELAPLSHLSMLTREEPPEPYGEAEAPQDFASESAEPSTACLDTCGCVTTTALKAQEDADRQSSQSSQNASEPSLHYTEAHITEARRVVPDVAGNPMQPVLAHQPGFPVYLHTPETVDSKMTGVVAVAACQIPLSVIPDNIVAKGDCACLAYVYYLVSKLDAEYGPRPLLHATDEEQAIICTKHPIARFVSVIDDSLEFHNASALLPDRSSSAQLHLSPKRKRATMSQPYFEPHLELKAYVTRADSAEHTDTYVHHAIERTLTEAFLDHRIENAAQSARVQTRCSLYAASVRDNILHAGARVYMKRASTTT